MRANSASRGAAAAAGVIVLLVVVPAVLVAVSNASVRPRLATARDGRAVALDARRDSLVVAPGHRSAGHLR